MEGMAKMNAHWWRGKRVLITGHTGFKGTWLSLWLRSLGADVTGFALSPSTQPSLFELARAADGIRSEIGDIRDPSVVATLMADAQPEIVFHLAAQPLVRYSYEHPIETYHTNVLGTVHLLDAVRRVSSVRAVVNVTSDKCYENREWVWGYREQDPMGGFDPYSNSKGCAELVTSAFRNSYFPAGDYSEHRCAIASARAGNVIGGGDWAEGRLIPDILRAIAAGEPVQVRSPRAIRPWQHVLEPLSGYLLLAERLHDEGAAYAEGWNFGPSDTDVRTVEWIVERMTRRWGDGAGWIIDEGDHPHEAAHLKLDSSKARQVLGWTPRWSLDETIHRIVDWHRAWVDGGDMRACTISQIEDYMRHV
ncbi:CDP-glucose 4,6-dehydratase [Paraburkholderia sp. C35]|uniref:CDP-glucose 4,6-dehydratase n=1 Tax=Paraburkholderia sp. C35 TaxID=2126993 RepID=UPI000D69A711|nr:CDP-glucose 4,6-dehydratase [Paraburkholderia sp. C35]